jgi:hypothetical protein
VNIKYKGSYLFILAALLVILLFPKALLYVFAIPAVLLGSIGLAITALLAVVTLFTLAMIAVWWFQENFNNETK